MSTSQLRHNWDIQEALSIYRAPLNDLLFQAQSIHRRHFDPNIVQLSALLSIKTGGCPEDCAYCPQSVRHDASLDAEPLMPVSEVIKAARHAKDAGASRFCMGAAWRRLRERDITQVVEMVRAVKSLGLETCMTLGMLTGDQARRLKAEGLDYYNHNLDTSPEYYGEVINTRTYEDRLETLAHVRDAGMAVCCGGILGMGESTEDRVGLLVQLANLPKHPESVPINLLVQVKGTPLYGTAPLDSFDFVRSVALARILMPASVVRLSAGRAEMSDELHALCFLAGANSIFCGDRLLTTPNAETDRDRTLFARLGLQPSADQHLSPSLRTEA